MVKAERKLVEVTGQVRGVHRSLVGAEQPTFCQRRDSMHAWQQRARVFAACTGCPLATTVMDVAFLLQSSVALPSISDHRCSRLDVRRHEGQLEVPGFKRLKASEQEGSRLMKLPTERDAWPHAKTIWLSQ